METPPSCCQAALLLNAARNWRLLTPLSLHQNTDGKKYIQGSKDTWLKAVDASTDCASSGPGNREALGVPNTHRGRKTTREQGVREKNSESKQE